MSLATAVMFSCALLQIPTIVCTSLTVDIETVITADCKLLPWQQMKLLCKYLLSSCVAKVTGHVYNDHQLCISFMALVWG